MLGSQLGFAWSSCRIDSDALSAVKAAGVEAAMNEPGVPGSEIQGICHFLCSSCLGSSRGAGIKGRVEHGHTPCTILGRSWHPCNLLPGKVYFSSIFFLFPLCFHKKPKQRGSFPSLHGGNCFSGSVSAPLRGKLTILHSLAEVLVSSGG